MHSVQHLLVCKQAHLRVGSQPPLIPITYHLLL
jgi:hypothetical protein